MSPSWSPASSASGGSLRRRPIRRKGVRRRARGAAVRPTIMAGHNGVAPARPPLPMTRRRRGRLPSHWLPRDIQMQRLRVPACTSAHCLMTGEVRKVPTVDNPGPGAGLKLLLGRCLHWSAYRLPARNCGPTGGEGRAPAMSGALFLVWTADAPAGRDARRGLQHPSRWARRSWLPAGAPALRPVRGSRRGVQFRVTVGVTLPVRRLGCRCIVSREMCPVVPDLRHLRVSGHLRERRALEPWTTQHRPFSKPMRER